MLWTKKHMEVISESSTRLEPFRILAANPSTGLNDVLCSAMKDCESHVVYFPGDIQNFIDDMPDKEFEEYSLENTLKILVKHYPRSNIYLIRPERTMGSSAEYDYFLNPGRCIVHMRSIVLKAIEESETKIGVKYDTQIPINLLAFSKGVLVLNNFLAEYSSLTSDPIPPLIRDWQDNVNGRPVIEGYPIYEPTLRIYRMRSNTNTFLVPNKDIIVDFVSRVKSIHWIDGHRFPTSREVVQSMADLQLKYKTEFYVHGTPRQLDDKKRKWITEEFNSFKSLMESYEVKSHIKMYFKGQPKTIQVHFKILHEFKG